METFRLSLDTGTGEIHDKTFPRVDSDQGWIPTLLTCVTDLFCLPVSSMNSQNNVLTVMQLTMYIKIALGVYWV